MTEHSIASERRSSFWKALRIQFRVIYALILREVITRYGRENIGFLWVVGEPVLFTAGIATVWSFGSAIHGHKVGVLEFAVTGYSSVLLWRNCANRAVNGIQPNVDLLYHRRVRVFDVYFARSFLEVIAATLSFFLIGIVLTFLGFMQAPYDLGIVLVAWVLLAWVAVSLALVIGPLSEMSELLERVWHIATYLFFPLSGAVFMVDWLSPGMRSIVLWIPMVHCLEMLRGAYFGPSVHVWFSVKYILTFCTIATFLGLSMIRYVSTRITRK
jgi:capsular polysaccharide transport system permease protein